MITDASPHHHAASSHGRYERTYVHVRTYVRTHDLVERVDGGRGAELLALARDELPLSEDGASWFVMVRRGASWLLARDELPLSEDGASWFVMVRGGASWLLARDGRPLSEGGNQ